MARYCAKHGMTHPDPMPGSRWVSVEDGETVEVESFDGAYAVVFGEHDAPGRGTTYGGKPFAFLVQPTHFGHSYVRAEA